MDVFLVELLNGLPGTLESSGVCYSIEGIISAATLLGITLRVHGRDAVKFPSFGKPIRVSFSENDQRHISNFVVGLSSERNSELVHIPLLYASET